MNKKKLDKAKERSSNHLHVARNIKSIGTPEFKEHANETEALCRDILDLLEEIENEESQAV
jgi:hypothetical protein